MLLYIFKDFNEHTTVHFLSLYTHLLLGLVYMYIVTNLCSFSACVLPDPIKAECKFEFYVLHRDSFKSYFYCLAGGMLQ